MSSETTPTLTFIVNIGVRPLYSSAIMTGSVLSIKTRPPHSRQKDVSSSVNGLDGRNDWLFGKKIISRKVTKRTTDPYVRSDPHCTWTLVDSSEACWCCDISKPVQKIVNAGNGLGLNPGPPVREFQLGHHTAQAGADVQEGDRHVLEIFGRPWTARSSQMLEKDVGGAVKQDKRAFHHLHCDHAVLGLDLVPERRRLLKRQDIRPVPGPAELGPAAAVSGEREDSETEENAAFYEVSQQVKHVTAHSDAAEHSDARWGVN
ncbi:hypothetical protein KL941_004478 [Ogataea angusta]|nr:hypothetical protein KL941_004478 [Ogataea angusta]